MTTEQKQEIISPTSINEIDEITARLHYLSFALGDIEAMNRRILFSIGNALISVYEKLAELKKDEDAFGLHTEFQWLKNEDLLRLDRNFQQSAVIYINLSVIQKLSPMNENERMESNIIFENAKSLLMHIEELKLYDFAMEIFDEQMNHLLALNESFQTLEEHFSYQSVQMPNTGTYFSEFTNALVQLKEILGKAKQSGHNTKQSREYQAFKDFQLIKKKSDLFSVLSAEIERLLQEPNLNDEETDLQPEDLTLNDRKQEIEIFREELKQFSADAENNTDLLFKKMKPILDKYIKNNLQQIRNGISILEKTLHITEQLSPNQDLANFNRALHAMKEKLKALKKALQNVELFCSLFLSMEKKLTINDFLKLTEGNSQLSELTYSYQDQQLGSQQPSYHTTSSTSFFSPRNQQADDTQQPPLTKRPRFSHDTKELSKILQPPTPKSTQSSNKESDLTPKPPGNR